MRKQNQYLLIASILGIIAVIVFIYQGVVIPNKVKTTEARIRAEVDDRIMSKTNVAIVVDDGGISKYTVLTDEIINQKIKFIEYPTKYCAKNVVSDVNLLKNKVTKEDIRSGEQINLDSLSTEKKWFGDFDRLKEYKVSSIVAGEVKTGNLVDIIVAYDDGKYDVVVPKVKVNKLIDESKSDPNQQNNPTATKPNNYTIVIAVDEQQFRDLELASKIGKLETRLYLDESQPASIKTFAR